MKTILRILALPLLAVCAFAADPLPVARPQPFGYKYSASTKTVTLQWVFYAEYLEALLANRNAEIAVLKAQPSSDLTAKVDALLARPTNVGLAVVMAKTGANVSLVATCDGNPPFAYKWTKNGQTLATTTAEHKLPNVSTADQGIYTVTISNASGSASGTTTVDLKVLGIL